MVSQNEPRPDPSELLTPEVEALIREAAQSRGWDADLLVEEIKRRIGEKPELRQELDILLLECFERAASAEMDLPKSEPT